MTPQEFPLVSIALPLYYSLRFFDIIVENLETIAYPKLEILVSDRHCADDTIDRLEERYKMDARFRFLRARDQISWVEHYNALLYAATGKYFLWMPHDDSFPAEFVQILVQALERYPDAMIAMGGMEALFSDGTRKMYPEHLPFSNHSPGTLQTAFSLYLMNALWLAFHGVMRRQMLLDKGLHLRATRDTFAADLVWDFAAALQGRIVYVRGCSYQKRYYPDSTHALWRGWGWRHLFAEITTLHAYLASPKQPLSDRARMWLSLGFWAAMRGGMHLLRVFHLYALLHTNLRDILLLVLRSPQPRHF